MRLRIPFSEIIKIPSIRLSEVLHLTEILILALAATFAGVQVHRVKLGKMLGEPHSATAAVGTAVRTVANRSRFLVKVTIPTQRWAYCRDTLWQQPGSF
jgi:hypothetical protein